MATIRIDKTTWEKRSRVLAELMGCIGVIAKRYPDTGPGAMAQICIREVYNLSVGETVTGFHAGPMHVQYRRIDELLAALGHPVALEGEHV